MLSIPFKYTLFLKLYGAIKIPLIAFVAPKVIELSDQKCIIEIPLNMRTRNHLNVMYFGALAIGAELSIALKSVQIIQEEKLKIDFLFKDFKAEFLKRADGPVQFICEELAGVTELMREAAQSTERKEKLFKAYAIVPSRGSEPIGKFELTLTVKNRRKIES